MQQKPKRRLSARARQVVGIATGLAVTAAAATAVTMLPSSANAEERPTVAMISNGYDALPPVPQDAAKRAVRAKDIPPGAKRATRGLSKPGVRSKLFQSPRASTRIVGGAPVRAANFPGVVGIRILYLVWVSDTKAEWWEGTCTGSVISPTRVLTAAHCGVDLNYGYIEVIAGRDVLTDNTSGTVAGVSHAWTEQGYNAAGGRTGERPINDVTVLTLKTALPDAYTPVRLAEQGAADPADGTDATIVGYGVTASGARDSGTLRAATVDIQSDADCAASAQYGAAYDAQRMLCAGDPPVADTCQGDSGGPIFTGEASSRVQVGITSWGDVCATKYGVYADVDHYSDSIKQQLTLTPANNLDWTGDGHSDIVARVRSTGDLVLGSGAGLVFGTPTRESDIGFSGFTEIGSKWNGYSKVFRVNNWSGDQTQSIFARDSAGRLFNWRSNGKGEFRAGGPVQIGTGWNKFTDIMVTNDWIGNGLPNLMGRTADGSLIIYNSDGRGGWSNPRGTLIGTGWTKFDTVLTPGSWLGDGKQSLIGRTPAGELILFNSNGAGGWSNPRGTLIGTGWGGFPTFMSPGDFNGDNLVDLLGVRKNGDLMLYPTNGRGAWLNGRGQLLGYNWTYFNLIF